MNIITTQIETFDGIISVHMTADKFSVEIYTMCGRIHVACKTAAHRRGGCNMFDTWELAAAGYKTEAMKAAIATARETIEEIEEKAAAVDEASVEVDPAAGAPLASNPKTLAAAARYDATYYSDTMIEADPTGGTWLAALETLASEMREAAVIEYPFNDAELMRSLTVEPHTQDGRFFRCPIFAQPVEPAPTSA